MEIIQLLLKACRRMRSREERKYESSALSRRTLIVISYRIECSLVFEKLLPNGSLRETRVCACARRACPRARVVHSHESSGRVRDRRAAGSRHAHEAQRNAAAAEFAGALRSSVRARGAGVASEWHDVECGQRRAQVGPRRELRGIVRQTKYIELVPCTATYG